MKIYVLMTKGQGKVICQDSVLVGNNILSEGYMEFVPQDNERVTVAVADGVGGNKGGDVASCMAVTGLRNGKFFLGTTLEHISRTIIDTNKDILDRSMADPGLEKMATTLTGIYMTPEQLLTFHVGNTRLCRLQGMYLRGLTQDTVDEGGRLTGCMGAAPNLINRLKVWDVTAEVKPGQDLILTSDGVHDHIPDEQMDEIMGMEGTKKEIMEQLEKTARDNGSIDDISIIWVSRKE